MLSNQIQVDKVLRSYLHSRKYSLTQLSQHLGLGVSTLHNYAYGQVPNGLISLVAIANGLNLGLDDLVFGGTHVEYR